MNETREKGTYEKIKSLTHPRVQQYLFNTGWEIDGATNTTAWYIKRTDETIVVGRLRQGRDDDHLMVPTTFGYDRVPLMCNTIRTLARIEGRKQAEVVEDILATEKPTRG